MSDITLDSLKSLIIFKVLYENKTATKAAKQLGITQSAVSRSIAHFEQTLGIPLFLRIKNRLVASPEGREMYEETLSFMTNLDDLRHTVLALKDFGSSRIRLATVPGLAFKFGPKMLAGIMRDKPNFSFYYDTQSSSQLIHSIETGVIDIGIITLPCDTRQLQVTPLLKVEAVCIIPRHNPLATLEVIHPNDLANQRLILSNYPHVEQDRLLRLLTKHKVHLASRISSSINGIGSLVANDVGVSIINPITAAAQVGPGQGRYVIRPFKPKIQFQYAIAYKRNWEDSELIQLIKKHIPERWQAAKQF